MRIRLTTEEERALRAALVAEQRDSHRKRYQAILLLGQGRSPAEVSGRLACSPASVYNWARTWGDGGLAGLQGKPRHGRVRLLDGKGNRVLTSLLGSLPEAHGYRARSWTVPLLQRELGRAGHVVQQRTIRRMLHRLGWRWQGSRYVWDAADPAETVDERGNTL